MHDVSITSHHTREAGQPMPSNAHANIHADEYIAIHQREVPCKSYLKVDITHCSSVVKIIFKRSGEFYLLILTHTPSSSRISQNDEQRTFK